MAGTKLKDEDMKAVAELEDLVNTGFDAALKANEKKRALLDDIGKLKAEEAHLEQVVATLEGHERELAQTNKELEAERETLESNLAKLGEETAASAEENESLQRKVEAQKGEISKLRAVEEKTTEVLRRLSAATRTFQKDINE